MVICLVFLSCQACNAYQKRQACDTHARHVRNARHAAHLAREKKDSDIKEGKFVPDYKGVTCGVGIGMAANLQQHVRKSYDSFQIVKILKMFEHGRELVLTRG